jgi:DUF1680 family protein
MNITLGDKKVKITQKADFPWNGRVEISVDPLSSRVKFALNVRIPGWVRNEAIPGGLYKFTDQNNENFAIAVNGEPFNGEVINGYVVIERNWKQGDRVGVEFPMPVRTVVADERIKDDVGKIAVQRGPVIYCAEWPDNNTGKILNLFVDKNSRFSSEFIPSLLEGTMSIKTTGSQTRKNVDGKIDTLENEQVTLIPYAFWNNRGPGQMMVWLPTKN